MKYTIPYDDKITLPHIKKIDSIGINADNLYYDSKELVGEVIISGDYLLDNSNDIMEFKHDIPVSFLIDDEKISPQINISNFKYELIPGRGIEVMFDLDVILTEDMEKEELIIARTKDEDDIVDENDMKEFQDKIDENLDSALQKRNEKKEKKARKKDVEIIEVRDDIMDSDDDYDQLDHGLKDEAPFIKAIEDTYDEVFPEDFVFNMNLQPTLTSFDTGFIPRDNDKYTTYKILRLENHETIEELLETRNLSKAYICKEYQFDDLKIVLKMEDE